MARVWRDSRWRINDNRLRRPLAGYAAVCERTKAPTPSQIMRKRRYRWTWLRRCALRVQRYPHRRPLAGYTLSRMRADKSTYTASTAVLLLRYLSHFLEINMKISPIRPANKINFAAIRNLRGCERCTRSRLMDMPLWPVAARKV